MENKEVERVLNEIHKTAERPLLDFERRSIQMDIYMLRTEFDRLEKDNKWQEQQLIVKEKALLLACEVILRNYRKRDNPSKERLKLYFENVSK